MIGHFHHPNSKTILDFEKGFHKKNCIKNIAYLYDNAACSEFSRHDIKTLSINTYTNQGRSTLATLVTFKLKIFKF